jgi:hypothetical protein
MASKQHILLFLGKIEEEISSFKKSETSPEMMKARIDGIITLATLAKSMLSTEGSAKPAAESAPAPAPKPVEAESAPAPKPKPKFKSAPCKHAADCKYGFACSFYHTKEQREVFKGRSKKPAAEGGAGALCIKDAE